ncbi:MAG: GNAT family N-acetyltransferase, partial [Promicromonosporaceae bacterium]|nr:GNAT family N-acetyltransferase [Promicromonosporaceae bacterium]
MESRVRRAGGNDLVDVAAICNAARQGARALHPSDDPALLRHLSAYLSAGGYIFLAEQNREVQGILLCRMVEPLFYAPDRSVVIDMIYVIPGARRQGVGHELMTALTELASEVGAT